MKAYRFSLILLAAISLGCLVGYWAGKSAAQLQFLGDIFLNLMFTAVVPLVFFSISTAVASIGNGKRLGKILGAMLSVFIVTGILASICMLVCVTVFPPAVALKFSDFANLAPATTTDSTTLTQKITNALTVPDFSLLLSKKNMLPLILFSVLLGVSVQATGEKGKPFLHFLQSGNEVALKLIQYIMYYAPIGLFAYFAALVGVLGPELLGTLKRAMLLYYPLSIAYFFLAFSLYAFWAGGRKGFGIFWKHILPPAVIALGTGSSMATLPANLEAARKMGTPQDIREVVIPMGATIHMDGSCLSAILKIAILFGIFGKDFSDPTTMAIAIGVALLSGTVMSGIPGGGFVGELLIIGLYDFPIEALPIIQLVGTLVDPTATAVNAIGDNVASMMVARITEGKNWMQNAQPTLEESEH